MNVITRRSLVWALSAFVVSLLVCRIAFFGIDPDRAAPPMGAPSPVVLNVPVPDAPASGAVERTSAIADAATIILVRDQAGAPLPECDILPWPLTDSSVPTWLHPALSHTDGAGRAVLSQKQLGATVDLVLRRRGYVLHRLVDVVPGDRREAVLQPAARLRVAVVSELREPVQGFSLALSQMDPASAPICGRPGDTYHAFGGPQAMANPTCVAKSGPSGVLLFEDLPPGQLFLTCNLEQGPYLVANWNDCLVANAPGELEIVTKELWAAVVRFVGDDPLVSAFATGPRSPFEMVSDTPNSLALRRAQRVLQEKHADCLVVVGSLADSRKSIGLAVHGLTGEWRTFEVPLARFREVAETPIVLEPGSEALEAKARVHLIDASSGQTIDSPGARVALRWRVNGIEVVREAELGVDVRIPPGPYDIGAAGELPPGYLPPTSRFAAPGTTDVAHLTVPAPLRRYRVQVRRPDGSAPSEFGFSISWSNSVQPEYPVAEGGARPSASIYTVHGDRHTFLSTATSHACRIFVKGYASMSVDLAAGSGDSRDGMETFTVTLAAQQAR